MLLGLAIALVGAALAVFQWEYWKWWSRRHQHMYFYKESRWWWLPGSLRLPFPDQLSPKRRRMGFLFGEAVAILLVVMGVAVALGPAG